MGDATSDLSRLSFNRQLRVEFRGATVTSAAGLLWPRELHERLGLGALIERHRTDPSTGRTRPVPLPDLFRQSISSRLAGYENTNNAERLATLGRLLELVRALGPPGGPDQTSSLQRCGG